MEVKTPKFDSLIEEVLKDIVPHKRICRWKGEHPHCEGEFAIQSEEISFFKNFKVPPPSFCPTCRRMRRMVNMNMLRLFKRECNAPLHGESVISILPPNCPFPVFDYKYFISDEFDAFSYGRKFNSNESPLEQLFALRRSFPMPSFLNRDPSSVNSEYSNGGRNSKNAYYTMAVFDSEDVWYSNLIRYSKEVMDSRMVRFSDQVYSGFASDHIYKSSFIYFSKDCTDSMFLFDCRNLDSCFGCVNLRGGRYKIWNEQVTKEDYEKFVKSIYPLTREKIEEYSKKFWDLIRSLPVNASRNSGSEDSTGAMLNNTRNVHDSSDIEEADHILHSDGVLNNQNSMDVLFSGGSSHDLYSCTNVGSKSSNMKFSMSTKYSSDCEFVFNCNNVANCFMSFGLRDKSYCIFNTQYSPQEYFSLLDEIKCEMLKRGEYGDWLDFKFSAQSYNSSIGQMTFPLREEDIIKLGGYLSDEQKTETAGLKIISPYEEGLDEEQILNSAILCKTTGKPFRITSSELAFYRKMKLPLPDRHPIERIHENFSLVPMATSYKAKCTKCSKDTYSVFAPDKNFILYCESCFQQEVY